MKKYRWINFLFILEWPKTTKFILYSILKEFVFIFKGYFYLKTLWNYLYEKSSHYYRKFKFENDDSNFV